MGLSPIPSDTVTNATANWRFARQPIVGGGSEAVVYDELLARPPGAHTTAQRVALIEWLERCERIDGLDIAALETVTNRLTQGRHPSPTSAGVNCSMDSLTSSGWLAKLQQSAQGFEHTDGSLYVELTERRVTASP